MVWARALVNFAPTTNAPTKINGLVNFETEYGADLIGATVRRMLITTTWAVITAGDSNQLGVGILKGSENLVALAPAGERHEDWMYWDVRGFHGALTDVYTYSADIRTGRKLDEINEEVAVHIAANSSGVFEYDILVAVSFLLALP